MKNAFCYVLISATSRNEANRISDRLVTKRLIAGSLIQQGSARYWWKDKIVKKKYYNLYCFTKKTNKKRIIAEVKAIHKDEVPIIAFFAIDANTEFLQWISASTK